MNTEKNVNEERQPALKVAEVSVSVIDLVWSEIESHSGKSWIALIKEFSTSYAIWIDRETGRTTVAKPNRERSFHNSVNDAKICCQEDFNEIVNRLILK